MVTSLNLNNLDHLERPNVLPPIRKAAKKSYSMRLRAKKFNLPIWICSEFRATYDTWRTCVFGSVQRCPWRMTEQSIEMVQYLGCNCRDDLPTASFTWWFASYYLVGWVVPSGSNNGTVPFRSVRHLRQRFRIFREILGLWQPKIFGTFEKWPVTWPNFSTAEGLRDPWLPNRSKWYSILIVRDRPCPMNRLPKGPLNVQGYQDVPLLEKGPTFSVQHILVSENTPYLLILWVSKKIVA